MSAWCPFTDDKCADNCKLIDECGNCVFETIAKTLVSIDDSIVKGFMYLVENGGNKDDLG